MLVPELSTPLLALYAETHFRFFPAFPSLLFRSAPEVLFDMPRRLAPGRDLPVLLILNDIERFPATLLQVQLSISCGGAPAALDFPIRELEPVPHPLGPRCAAYLLNVPRSRLDGPVAHVNGKAVLRVGGRQQVVLNDNFPGTSKLCLSCRVADEDYPGHGRASFGDLHVHSIYSESHVEFGPPLAVIDRMCHASGMAFVGVTDHSYDLACATDDYLRGDPGLARWNAFQEELARGAWQSVMVPGEEVSCVNGQGKVVHLGALGVRALVPGTLDGARTGRRRERQLSVAEALDAIHAQEGVGFAAHPGARSGLLQSWLLSRGVWSGRDVGGNALDAMQGSNGAFLREWQTSRMLWVKALLSGRRLPLVAGNDAHGDFNRYRCIGTPFLSITELMHRSFGAVRSGVYGMVRSGRDVLDAVRSGRTLVTSGPFVDIAAGTESAETLVGSVQRPAAVAVRASSTREFGPLTRVVVYRGEIGARRERVVASEACETDALRHDLTVPADALGMGNGYIRAECMSMGENGVVHTAASSPVYVSSTDR